MTMPAPSNLLPWLNWRYSLLLPIAILALSATLAYQIVDGSNNDPGQDNSPLEIAALSETPTAQATNPPSTVAPTVAVTQPVSTTTPTKTASTPVASTADRAVEGVVTDPAGDPIRGARVTDGEHLQITGKDGLFSFKRGEIGSDATLTVIATGYLTSEVTIAGTNGTIDIPLDLRPIKGIYMNPSLTTTDADIDRLIEIVDTTEVNAIVLDIKEELVYYDSQVDLFVDNDTVVPAYDVDALLKKFQDHHIYVIARLVVFKDSKVAEQNPDLAVINKNTGDVWRDMNGVAWVNPMMHELWEANTDLALEAAEHGFDEIQYDYVRFPTDGDIEAMDFGLERTQENREASIQKFLEMSREKLLPTGTPQSADVFGYTMLVDDDLGIGQNFINLADYVDYLSPMIYPSHFPDGSIDVPGGRPNDYPYETIEISLRHGKNKLDGDALKMRPWLQDFDFWDPDYKPYGDADVRAQIDAANDIGTSGWLLWDPNNRYHPKALDPEPNPSAPNTSIPNATPDATPATISTRSRARLRRTPR